MNQQAPASPLGKALVALAVLGSIGGSAYFIMNPGKSQPPAAKPAASPAPDSKPAVDKPKSETPSELKPQDSKAAEPGSVQTDAK